MDRQMAWVAGKPEEDLFVRVKGSTESFHGKLRSADQFTKRAVESARRHDLKEFAAAWQALEALTVAEFGYPARARQLMRESVEIGNGKDVQIVAALALARAEDASGAEPLLKELSERFPSDTLVKNVWVPTIRAQLELNRGNATAAIELLQSAVPYEKGFNPPEPALFPAFVRGEAYLQAHDGKAAQAEFRKILDNPGITPGSSHGALAHLGLARAYALQRDTVKARAAYNDFFTLWKDADPDIPILKDAKTEYAKLQ
jgi:predicted Zn-dependent protease